MIIADNTTADDTYPLLTRQCTVDLREPLLAGQTPCHSGQTPVGSRKISSKISKIPEQARNVCTAHAAVVVMIVVVLTAAAVVTGSHLMRLSTRSAIIYWSHVAH